MPRHPSWRRRLTTRLVLLMALGAPCATAVAALTDDDSPVGRWQTFDDRTRKPSGMVRIVEQDGRLFGQIERDADHHDEQDRCVVCTDERKDQPIDGLVIIRNMHRSVDDPQEWLGGDILDPRSGKLYGFRMRVADHGSKLVVRGYLGVSLIGRTQTWSRLGP